MKFKVNGHEVFASTGGRPFDKKKPLIIFVHGSGLTHITWVLQTRYFAFHGYNALAIDLPGHGLSSGESLKSIEEMADWVNNVIDAVDILTTGIKFDFGDLTLAKYYLQVLKKFCCVLSLLSILMKSCPFHPCACIIINVRILPKNPFQFSHEQ